MAHVLKRDTRKIAFTVEQKYVKLCNKRTGRAGCYGNVEKLADVEQTGLCGVACGAGGLEKPSCETVDRLACVTSLILLIISINK